MKADMFYRNRVGRSMVLAMQKTGVFRLAAWTLRTRASKPLIHRYIRKNNIDMEPFSGQRYRSFAEFFGRRKECAPFDSDGELLLSPCDGLLSIYPVDEGMVIPMKNSHYRLTDLVPKEEIARTFSGGLCLVFRLQAEDYHHFCFFDSGELQETHYIPGQLHSVQPIACESVPVYRLNRRWWSVLNTEHFQTAVQIEVGAMLVGGVSFAKECGQFSAGEEMGHFELAGSTIVLLLDSQVKNALELSEAYRETEVLGREVPVTLGCCIGSIRPGEEETLDCI